MRAKIYQPSPLFLPQQLVESDSAVRELLLSYTSSYCYGANSNALLRFGLDEILDAKDAPVAQWRQVTEPTQAERLALLQHPVPLYYDVFLCRAKLLALGPYLPGMDELLGQPRIFLRRHDQPNNPIELSYFKEDNYIPYRPGKQLDRYLSSDPHATPKFFRPLSYLVIDKLPPELLGQLSRQAAGLADKQAGASSAEQPNGQTNGQAGARLDKQLDEWSLLFKFKDFEQEVKLQANPFAGAPPKSTLLTLQKDNPAEWISNWCSYYHREHGVERIIIYHNAPIETASESPADKISSGPKSSPTSFTGKNLPYLETAPDSPASRHLPDTGTASSPCENLELYYVEWPHYYQQYFNHCQVGALNHAYHWLGDAAAYFLNFDIDEYLVNSSNKSIGDYLRGKYSDGFTAACYEVPADIPAPPHTAQSNSKASGSDAVPADIAPPQQKDLGDNSEAAQNAADNSPLQDQHSMRRESARAMLPTVSYGKSIYRPNCWDLVQVHENTREAFFIRPAYQQLLRQPSKPSAWLWLSKYLYRYPFLLPSVADKLRIKEAPPEDFYFLHYRALSTNWKHNHSKQKKQ